LWLGNQFHLVGLALSAADTVRADMQRDFAALVPDDNRDNALSFPAAASACSALNTALNGHLDFCFFDVHIHWSPRLLVKQIQGLEKTNPCILVVRLLPDFCQ